jgi:hypothetical protein
MQALQGAAAEAGEGSRAMTLHLGAHLLSLLFAIAAGWVLRGRLK